MPRTALYPGTFDPFTNGHLHILNRAKSLFDHIIIAIHTQSDKKPLMPLKQRVELIAQLFQDDTQITVQPFDGLLVDFATQVQVTAIVRGVRNSQDFSYEQQLAAMNLALAPNIETVLLMAHPDVAHISSTWVRDIVRNGGAVSAFVPACIASVFER